MKLKELNDTEITSIYRSYMTQDFPQNERKPLRTILSLRKRGIYYCYGMFDKDQLLAYAFVCGGEQACLLDYYAVCAPFRGRGYGTGMLRGMRALLPKLDLLAEVEDPEKATTPEEEATRRRRIAFYERLDFTLTDTAVCLFGVDYRIMVWHPEGREEDYDIAEALTALYDEMMGLTGKLFLKMGKVPKRRT